MKTNILLVSVLCASALASGCAQDPNSGPSNLSTSNATEDSVLHIADSVLAVMGSALNDVEQSVSIVKAKKPSKFSLIENAYAGACSLDRFLPPIGSTTCLGAPIANIVNVVYSNCTIGSGNEFVMNGNVLLTFDAAQTCSNWINGGALPTSGKVTRTMNALTRTFANGAVVTNSSTLHSNYKGQNISGGIETTFDGADTRRVKVHGIHRTRSLPGQVTGFDHSVRTTQTIEISGTQAAGNRTMTEGTVVVDHNQAKYSVSVSPVNGNAPSWSNNCCYPVSGEITLTATGTLSGTMSVVFDSTCGRATLSNGAVSQVLQLSACE